MAFIPYIEDEDASPELATLYNRYREPAAGGMVHVGVAMLIPQPRHAHL